MNIESLPKPDRNGIIRVLPRELSTENKQRIKKFGFFMFLYDYVQDYYVRPRIHKADLNQHRHMLQYILSPIKDSSILDIACGTGACINGHSTMSEGCLSLPGTQIDVHRSDNLLLNSYTPTGKKSRMHLSFLWARVVQHEIDHLNGILILIITSESTMNPGN